MCDVNSTGQGHRSDFVDLIRSLKAIVGVDITDNTQNNVINKIAPIRTASLNSFAVPTSTGGDSVHRSVFGTIAAVTGTYRQHIFILFIFCCTNLMIFLERFRFHRYENQHLDQHRVMGVGIAITRGAAGAVSFCLGVVLLTVCRNVITIVRGNASRRVHPVRFRYRFPQDLNFLPRSAHWFYGHFTGLPDSSLRGDVNHLLCFALQVHERAYHAFVAKVLELRHWSNSHFCNRPNHGNASEIQGELNIINAELLPSDIIYLQFKRPWSFHFRSGQWVRISSPTFSSTFNEWHAFSLASAPQSPTVELYIKVCFEIDSWHQQGESRV
ncbi:hypothetical protein OSTOST_03180 [Ostertagia ostertagi]